MKALSVRQPWAWLLVHGIKDVENRTWATKYRGLLAIHAGQRADLHALQNILLYSEKLPDCPWKELMGGIVGIVRLKDIEHARSDVVSSSPWAFALWKYYHWIIEPVEAFDRPVPFKGRLGLFEVPDELLWRTA